MSEEKNTEKTEKKTKAKDTKKGVSFEALSSLDAPVSFWKGIPFGLQHVMAMFVANLAPIFLVATAAKMDAAQSAAIIQAGLLVAGLGTCLQLYGVWLIGSRLPMVTGISFTYVAAAMSIAQHQGYGAVAGAVVLGGLLEVVLGLTAKYWRRFVPPIVSAIVVTSIGFSLLDHDEDADFSAALSYVRPIIERAMNSDALGRPLCLNVNVPNLPADRIKGIKACRQNRGFWREEFERRQDPRGQDYYWLTGYFHNTEPGAQDTDEWALDHGYVSIVPIQVDLTNYCQLERMKRWEDDRRPATANRPVSDNRQVLPKK